MISFSYLYWTKQEQKFVAAVALLLHHQQFGRLQSPKKD